MVAQQKIKDSSVDCATEISASPTSMKMNPGSPKSRLAKLKRSSTKAKANISASNDPFRFQGNGVDFKGKLIGERDVAEARGDAMCAEAMRLAKASVKSSGSHKQRIVLNISIEGLKIKDEKSGTVFYNFPVAKISFIARDTTDARAFGFIFGTSADKYKFYGIKTAQTADHAVLSIRDMFQVVFEMKKKQIMEVKQKQEEQENMERENSNSASDSNGGGCRMEDGVAVADLLDLESELQNIELGFNQLQNIPSMPEDEGFNGGWGAGNDPFGDSFNPNPQPVFAPAPMSNVEGTGAWFYGQNGYQQQPHHQNGSAAGVVYSGTNPFSMLTAQPQPSSLPVAFSNGATVLAADPFDTQSAHRVINAINNTHTFGLPPPTMPLAPPTMMMATLPMPVQLPTEVNWGNTSSASSATSLKENNGGFEFGADFSSLNGHSSSPSNGTDKQQGWEEPKRVTTLEEAFTKLVDMNQLVSTTNGTANAAKKNPFEHILNPPKMPLSALASGSPITVGMTPSVGLISNGQQKQQQYGLHSNGGAVHPNGCMINGHNGTNGHALNGHTNGIKAGASDPFNDDFFN